MTTRNTLSIAAIAGLALSSLATAGNYTSYFGEDLNLAGQGRVCSASRCRTRGPRRVVPQPPEREQHRVSETFSDGAQASPINLSFTGSAGNIGASLSGSPLEIRSGEFLR